MRNRMAVLSVIGLLLVGCQQQKETSRVAICDRATASWFVQENVDLIHSQEGESHVDIRFTVKSLAEPIELTSSCVFKDDRLFEVCTHSQPCVSAENGNNVFSLMLKAAYD